MLYNSWPRRVFGSSLCHQRRSICSSHTFISTRRNDAVSGNSHLTPSSRLINPLVNARCYLQLTLLLFPAHRELLISSSDLLSGELIYKFIFFTVFFFFFFSPHWSGQRIREIEQQMGSGVGFTAFTLVRNWDDSELGREMLSKAQLDTVITTQPHCRERISHRSSADNLGFQRFFSWPHFINQKVCKMWIFYICWWEALSPDMQNNVCPGGKTSDIVLQTAKLSAEKRKALPGNLAAELWYQNSRRCWTVGSGQLSHGPAEREVMLLLNCRTNKGC